MYVPVNKLIFFGIGLMGGVPQQGYFRCRKAGYQGMMRDVISQT